MVNPGPGFAPLPIAGRAAELATLRASLERAARGSGGTVFLHGPEGIGKTRLAQAVREEAKRRGFLVATGCAYPLESGIPYTIFRDLLDPLLRSESKEAIAALTRGAPEFRLIFPSLSDDESASLANVDEIPDLRNRLLWNFPAFLDRLRKGKPLLLIFEDLEWADPSSLELLHFLGRRSREAPFLVLCTSGTDERDARSAAQDLSRTLVGRAEATVFRLAPLCPESVLEAVSGAFDVSAEIVRGFAKVLSDWTGGNPLFLGSVLESLVASGRLRKEGGRWIGWGVEELPFPGSVREMVMERLDALSSSARRVIELVAAIGTTARFDLLKEVSFADPDELLAALDELQTREILREGEDATDVVVAFVHPLVREVLYAEMGLARTRTLHTEIARALERIHGDEAIRHASELAVHVLHGAADGTTHRAEYLAEAGRAALQAHANRQAALYLEGAIRFLPEPSDAESRIHRCELLVSLARARQRTGRYAEAQDLLHDARKLAERSDDHRSMSRVDRRLGLASFWSGRFVDAIEHWNRGVEEAEAAGDLVLKARIRLGLSACLQEIGQLEEAARMAREALRLGEEQKDARVQVAAHRTLVLLHAWMGPPDLSRAHGERALAPARELGDDRILFSVHWALAVAEGLTGHATEVRGHMEEGKRIVERLGSPLAVLLLAEIEIEYWAGTGAWDRGVDIAEESIRMARELDQRMVLPRLLVWSGLLHLNRGDLDVARAQLDEAWELARKEEGTGPATAHLLILAHVGRTALHLALGEYREAIQVGEAGMELVDRSGHRAWGVHRLLPLVGEAALHLRDLDRARLVAKRLRKEAKVFDHALGLVWADAADAVVTWLAGDPALGARRMAVVVERLESMDSVPDAARLRRQLAGRLAELGDREAAIRELRRVHDILSALGATPELDKARVQFREVGARPPVRGTAPGVGTLTERETEIARLVGERRSNKAIGKALGISSRTAGTHLSNIFRKLGVDSREKLGDLVRDGFLDAGG